MVHSAMKRKRSLEALSDEVRHESAPVQEPTETPQEVTNIDSLQTPSIDMIWQPLADEHGDPRATVLALLGFLSDVELFTLITHRVAHAAPYGPPLYLTPFCVCGIHDFFVPQRSAMEALPNTASDDSPFAKLPRLRDEKGRIGKVTGSIVKERAAALLVSLATLLHFLTPQELRSLIQGRVATSEAPHEGVRWFLEFMNSGGDGIPRGKRDLDQRVARGSRRREKARRVKAEKRLAMETSKGESSVPTEPGPMVRVRLDVAPASANTGAFSKAEGISPTNADEQEEGEIPDGMPASTVQPPPRKKASAKRKKKPPEPSRDNQAHVTPDVGPASLPKEPS